MTYRVIQWATGGVGRAAIEGVLAHPELELAGCWVHSKAKHGRDAGGLAGREPVGITERFPLMVSALSSRVTRVRAEEFSDIRTYAAPEVVRDVMLFGKTPEEARESIMTTVLGHGFKQSVRMVADEMGFPIEPELR